jgi:hypothetical protein
MDDSDEIVADLRAIVVGKRPEENNGMRKDLRSIADSLREFKAENKFLKWGIGILLMSKIPDIIKLIEGVRF